MPYTTDMDSPAERSARLPLFDKARRPLRDLRVSVLDRCNFRCSYCMPRQVFNSRFQFLPHDDLLNFEEISRLVHLFALEGVQKVRLTGGEPLLRRDLSTLVRMLSAIPQIEIALTTNGSLLAEQAPALAQAGLSRITVSLDSIDDAVFRAMNDVDFPVSRVLAGIEAAKATGLPPAKINAVIRRGVNDHTVLQLAQHFKGTGHTVRFIEFMDVGQTNSWQRDQVVSSAEIIARIHEQFPLEPVAPRTAGEVAKRWRYQDDSGEIGVISSVTQPFCGDCTRGRLSTDGKFFTCLFASQGLDLRTLLRTGQSDQEILAAIKQRWTSRDDRYSELRSEQTLAMKRMEMSYLGG